MAHQEAGEVLLEVAVEASVSFGGPKVSSASAWQAATSQSSGSAGVEVSALPEEQAQDVEAQNKIFRNLEQLGCAYVLSFLYSKFSKLLLYHHR